MRCAGCADTGAPRRSSAPCSSPDRRPHHGRRALDLVVGAVSAAAAFLALPAALTLPTTAPSPDAAAALAVLGVGGTGIAFLLFYTLIAEIGPARAAIVAYLAPGFAVLYGVTLRDEVVTPWTLAGLALVLGGSWIASRPRRPEATRIKPSPAAARASAR